MLFCTYGYPLLFIVVVTLIGIAVGGGLALLFCGMSLVFMTIKRNKRGKDNSKLSKVGNYKSTPKIGKTSIKMPIRKSNYVISFYNLPYFHATNYFKVDKNSSIDHLEKNLGDAKIEENEFGVIENPYYGDAEVIALNPTQKSPTTVDLNNVQFLTATQNLYYEM